MIKRALKRRLCKQDGFTLVEVLLVIFVLALTALILAAVFPSSQVSRIKAAHLSYAVSLAHQKVEELRSAGYSGVLVSPTVETPLPELPNGVQRITVSQYAPNIKKIEVSITWGGYRQVQGSTNLVTLISDHS
ncbi:MAG: prepilin-type N-terminal cleavage/methylation domain-containing protein [Armatimonadota bacterium]|nr:prepilin-type N-terminal cleavage/methylation domain-containing protein [Armatimonadota bacterium]